MKETFTLRCRSVLCVACAVLLVLCCVAPGDTTEDTGEDFKPFEAGLELSPLRPAPSLPVPPAESPPQTLDDAAHRETLVRSIRRIRRLIAEGNLERARTELAVDLRVYPDHPGLLALAGTLYTRQGEFGRAEESWARLAELAVDNHEVLSIWAGVQLRLGEFEQAERILNRATALQAYHATTVFHLICLYAATDRMEQAETPLKGMSTIDLTQMARWLESDSDTLISIMGVQPYVRIVESVLRGGAGLPRDTATPPPANYLPLSPAGEDVSGLFPVGARVDEEELSRTRDQLNQVNQVLAQFGRAIHEERWMDAARIGTYPRVARLGLAAPAFQALAQYARFSAGEEVEALQALFRLRHRYPDSLFPALRLAEALLVVGRAEDALIELDDMDVRYPHHAFEILLRACAHAETGRTAAALARLEMLDENMRGAVDRWFLSETPYQQAILNDAVYAAWRRDYLMRE